MARSWGDLLKKVLLPTPTEPKYDNSTWDESKKGAAALNAYNTAKDKVNNYEKFTYGNQAQLDEIMKKILSGEKFSYDLNGDALYQQYKDKYIKQGKMAMGDAIGQASAMTGGYGNSYAQSVGQQQYQASLDNLNDIVPELYQMAYDKYTADRQELYNQYGMLTDDYDRAYGIHQDGYQKLLDQLGIYQGDYYSGGDMFYTEQNNKNDIASKTFNDAMSIWKANEEARIYEEEKAYREKRDKIEDEQRQFDESQKKNSVTGQGSGGGTGNEQGNKPKITAATETEAIKDFKSKLYPESAHDAVSRAAYGSYKSYVAVQIAKSDLSEEEQAYLMSEFGVDYSDLEYAINKNKDIEI